MNSESPVPPVNNRWPKQIKYIVGNEACERFSFYGMKGILAGYITGATLHGGLGQSTDRSTEIIHLFVSANYFMPLLGAWLSDKIIGRFHTILWVSLFYCLGHGVLACSDLFSTVDARLWCLFTGLAIIAIGAGGIKPCVSAFMGDQFKPDQSHLLQKAFGAFYWSINLGSFFSFLVIPWIKNRHGYSWAFGVPGIFMGLATLVFWLGSKHYLRVPPSRTTKNAGFFKVFWHALTSPKEPGPGFWGAARRRFSETEVAAAQSVLPILGVFMLISPFWSLFDQTSSTWIKQGEQMIPFDLFGLKIGAEEMQSANPALVMLLVPLLTLLIYPRLGKFASPLRRMSYGMFICALSYIIVAGLQQRLEAGAQLSVAWQLLPYVVLTVAEVLVSTTGLELAFREAAPEMKSLITGFWWLTVTIGNLLVVFITKFFATGQGDESVTSGRFMMYAGLMFAVAIVFSVATSFYKYRDAAAAQGR